MYVQTVQHLMQEHTTVLVLRCFGFMPLGLMAVLEMDNIQTEGIIPMPYLGAPILVAMVLKIILLEVGLVEVEQGRVAKAAKPLKVQS